MKPALQSILNLPVIVAAIVGARVLVALMLTAAPRQALRLIAHFHLSYRIAFTSRHRLMPVLPVRNTLEAQIKRKRRNTPVARLISC